MKKDGRGEKGRGRREKNRNTGLGEVIVFRGQSSIQLPWIQVPAPHGLLSIARSSPGALQRHNACSVEIPTWASRCPEHHLEDPPPPKEKKKKYKGGQRREMEVRRRRRARCGWQVPLPTCRASL